MSIKLSALICTRNRAHYVRKAIESLLDQSLSPELYEIIVVDNNSEDETRQVVEAYLHDARVRYLCEPVAGLSRARNTGWKAARAPYVAFLDDDAVARHQWAEKYVEAFETTSPMPGSVGGKCEPIWEVERPDWLSDKLLSSLSVYDWSPTPMILSETEWVSGCNIGYPAAVLQEIGGFREDLGRVGNRLLAGEETFVRRQLDERGYHTLYHPEIVVGHHISAARLNKAWFRKHAFGTGESEAFMQYGLSPVSFGRRVQLGAQRVAWLLPRVALMLAARTPDKRFYREYQAYESAGFVSGLWQLHRSA